VFNALKWVAWTGAPWRALLHDFPPWSAVYQQAMHWLAAGAFQAMMLLPRRWVAERSFAWATRFRRLAKDYERLPGVLAGCHFIAFAAHGA
jgi:transposase